MSHRGSGVPGRGARKCHTPDVEVRPHDLAYVSDASVAVRVGVALEFARTAQGQVRNLTSLHTCAAASAPPCLQLSPAKRWLVAELIDARTRSEALRVHACTRGGAQGVQIAQARAQKRQALHQPVYNAGSVSRSKMLPP